MSYVLKVSKAGYNAITETNPNNLIFSSEYNTLKYYSSGSASLSVSGADTETYITHSLGYEPVFFVYCNSPVFTSRYSMTPVVFEDFNVYSYIESYADSNKIYFTVHTNTLTATVTFLYKIFRNRLNL